MEIKSSEGFFKPENKLGVEHKGRGLLGYFKKETLQDKVDSTSSKLVHQVWNNVNREEITKEEIELFDKLDQALGKAEYDSTQAVALHKFVQIKEGSTALENLLLTVGKVRKKNIELLKSGGKELTDTDKEMLEYFKASESMVSVRATFSSVMDNVTYEGAIKAIGTNLEERAIFKNRQVLTDSMLLAVDHGHSKGEEGRYKSRLEAILKDEKVSTEQQKALAEQGFLPRESDYNGVWQKGEWVVEDGEDLGKGKILYRKGYVKLTFAIPGHDIRTAKASLDISSLGALKHDDVMKVFEAISYFTGHDSPSISTEDFSFLSEEKIKELNRIAFDFRDQVDRALLTSLISLGTSGVSIKGVERNVEEFEAKRKALEESKKLAGVVFQLVIKEKEKEKDPKFFEFVQILSKSKAVREKLQRLIDASIVARVNNLNSWTKDRQVDLKRGYNKEMVKLADELNDLVVEKFYIDEGSGVLEMVPKLADYGFVAGKEQL